MWFWRVEGCRCVVREEKGGGGGIETGRGYREMGEGRERERGS